MIRKTLYVGCKVIGFAGDDKKLEWLKNDCGFDQVYNYKNVDIGEVLKKDVPQGIDCYFDSVNNYFPIN